MLDKPAQTCHTVPMNTYTPETKAERQARIRRSMQRYNDGTMLRDLLAKGEKAAANQEGATMATSTDLDLTTSAGRTSEVIRIMHKLDTTSADKVLSALGHPGYGDEYASKVLYEWQRNPGQSLHAVVYSGIKYGV